MTPTKPHIDVLIVVPIAVELEALYQVFPYEGDTEDDTFQFTRVHSPNTAISVYVIKLQEMGNAPARDACTHVLERYTVGLIICYGIAGGLKNDLRLGDVSVSQHILDLTDQFKIQEQNGSTSIALSPRHIAVDIHLCSRLAFLCEHPKFRDLKVLWTESCLEYLLNVEANYPNEFDAIKDQLSQDVRVFFGPIVSYGGVIASDSFIKDLKSLDRNVLAVDTESAGVFQIANLFEIPAITVRGISDFSDSKKSTLEAVSKEKVRSIAAINAAYYLYSQLKSPTIAVYLSNRREHIVHNSTGNLFAKTPEEPLDIVLQEIEQEIDSQLKETCPAYRHKPPRSLLPSPRILRVDNPTQLEKSEDWDMPREISEIVEQFERILISLEPTYPDKALPWVIADIILRTNGSRLYIPIVVSGDQVSPHRFQISRLERKLRIEEVGSQSITPVIIIDDPNIQSSTRMKALIEEANANPEVRFIAIVKKHNSAVMSANFAESFNCQRFSIANFSLGALSNFVASNFGYDLPQAVVLATKLNDTFEQYHMHAHPSYFAGISPESLAALMAANRRGELIQLAVDAALMVMVAEDEEDVQVSKRWRKEFLMEVAVRQYVKGENVDEESAVRIARERADNRGLDMRALEFVQSFIKAGIIEFEDGKVDFLLVYVRDYLLAEYLHSNPQAAAAYFNFNEVNEDFNVLDMYAELGASDEIVERVLGFIEEDAKWLDEQRPGTRDKLIRNEVALSEVNSVEEFSRRSKNVFKSIEYVGENAEDLQRKQHLLDLRRSASQRLGQRVEEESGVGAEEARDVDAVSESRASREFATEEGSEETIPRGKISAHWSAGSIILGSGAEQIEAEGKLRLARALVQLGCRVAEQWTAEVAAVDFGELRREILGDPEFIKLKQGMSDEKWKELMRDFDHLLHQLEFTFITIPYRTLLAALCQQASGNVLRRTVREVKLERNFEELTRAVWLCELDAANAKGIFASFARHIGGSMILRFVLAEHFVSRVYWTKWKPSERNAFLEVSGEIMKGLTGRWDKGKMRRMITRTSDD